MNQLPVGLIAQLVEHSTRIAKVFTDLKRGQSKAKRTKHFPCIVTEILTFNVLIKFICLFIQQDSRRITFLFSKVRALSRFFESLAKNKYLKSIHTH